MTGEATPEAKGFEESYAARMRRPCIAVMTLLLVSACSSSTSTAIPSSEDGSGSGTATLGGKTFTIASGLATIDTTLSIVLSDKAGLCDAVTAGKLRAGETLLQAYELTGNGTGNYTVSKEQPVKYARLKSGCTGGPDVEDNTDVSSRAETANTEEPTATVTITAITDHDVSGTLTATFLDGSTSNLSFTVPICASGPPEDAMCE